MALDILAVQKQMGRYVGGGIFCSSHVSRSQAWGFYNRDAYGFIPSLLAARISKSANFGHLTDLALESYLTWVLLYFHQPSNLRLKTEERGMVQLYDSQPNQGGGKFHTKSERFWKLNLGTSTTSYLSAIFPSACRICFSQEPEHSKKTAKLCQNFAGLSNFAFWQRLVHTFGLRCLGPGGPNFATNLILLKVSNWRPPILLPIWYSLYSPLQSIIIEPTRDPTSPTVLMLVYI